MDNPFAGTKGDGVGGGVVSCGGGDVCVAHDPFTEISTLRFSSEPSRCVTVNVYLWFAHRQSLYEPSKG